MTLADDGFFLEVEVIMGCTLHEFHELPDGEQLLRIGLLYSVVDQRVAAVDEFLSVELPALLNDIGGVA